MERRRSTRRPYHQQLTSQLIEHLQSLPRPRDVSDGGNPLDIPEYIPFTGRANMMLMPNALTPDEEHEQKQHALRRAAKSQELSVAAQATHRMQTSSFAASAKRMAAPSEMLRRPAASASSAAETVEVVDSSQDVTDVRAPDASYLGQLIPDAHFVDGVDESGPIDLLCADVLETLEMIENFATMLMDMALKVGEEINMARKLRGELDAMTLEYISFASHCQDKLRDMQLNRGGLLDLVYDVRLTCSRFAAKYGEIKEDFDTFIGAPDRRPAQNHRAQSLHFQIQNQVRTDTPPVQNHQSQKTLRTPSGSARRDENSVAKLRSAGTAMPSPRRSCSRTRRGCLVATRRAPPTPQRLLRRNAPESRGRFAKPTLRTRGTTPSTSSTKRTSLTSRWLPSWRRVMRPTPHRARFRWRGIDSGDID